MEPAKVGVPTLTAQTARALRWQPHRACTPAVRTGVRKLAHERRVVAMPALGAAWSPRSPAGSSSASHTRGGRRQRCRQSVRRRARAWAEIRLLRGTLRAQARRLHELAGYAGADDGLQGHVALLERARTSFFNDVTPCAQHPRLASRRGSLCYTLYSVSYTHLTLPTICSV